MKNRTVENLIGYRRYGGKCGTPNTHIHDRLISWLDETSLLVKCHPLLTFVKKNADS